MTGVESYRKRLRAFKDWDSFLLKESGLPGPRGNLELAQAVADEGDENLFRRYLTFDARKAPTNSPYEFLAFCGVVGLGRLVAEGRTELLPLLRASASDIRWRTREGVAMALQRLGEKDMALLLQEMERWGRGNLFEKRAAAAALCEPKLLRVKEQIKKVIDILDEITDSLQNVENRQSDEFQVLKKGLSYCWSVAVAAYPEEGKKIMEKWMTSSDRDIIRIMKENLKKNRLRRMDAKWLKKWQAQSGGR
jgi:hypothetical protein